MSQSLRDQVAFFVCSNGAVPTYPPSNRNNLLFPKMLTLNASQRLLPLGTSCPQPAGSQVKFVSSCDTADSSDEDRTSDDDGTSDDGNSDESVVSPSFQLSDLQKPRRSSLRSTDRRRDSTRSVGFSTVQTRVFEMIIELNVARPEALNAIEDELIWRFADSVSDIETHQNELEEERKSEYSRMIDDHIQRVELEKMERELKRQRQEQRKEKKGFRSKVLKPLWKGFIEATSRSAFTISPAQF